MRKALVGLSSPIGYNYSNNIEEIKGRPNPVLDSPMGLFLFYDEIWFVNKRTCPYNCENLPYVKFLDEEYDLNKLDLEQFSWENIEIEKHLNLNNIDRSWDVWTSSVELNMGIEKNGVDNHGRGFKIGKINATPNQTAINLIVDDYLANHFGLELITNTLTSILASSNISNVQDEAKRNLTQMLICENIPNFQLPDGPYHDFIEDLRTESLLKNFRTKIDDITSNKSETELAVIKKELESSMDKYLYELILKNLNKDQIFKGIFNASIGQVPILGNIYSGLDGGMTVYNNIKDRNESGWMGFIAKSRLIIP